jgi:hypothetical protein
MLLLSACLGTTQQVATPPPAAPAAPPTVASPAPAKPSPIASPSPSPAAAAQPAATAGQAPPNGVWVGNTDGEGVYIRRTPTMADRVRAYPDSTQLEIIGEDVFGDGQRWHHVKAPDGLEGYVPVIYTVDTPP